MVKVSRTRKTDAAALRNIRNMLRGPKQVKVGFPSGKASSSVLDKAVANNFGTVKIPARPFMNNAMHKGRGTLRTLVRRLAHEVVGNETTLETGLSQLGIKGQGLIQKEIVDLRTPPNSAQTIARKGSSNPLIDSGEMRQAVTWDIVK